MSVQHRSPGDPLKIKASEWNSIARVVNSAISQGMTQVRGGVKVATCLVPKTTIAHRGIAIDPTPIASDLSPSKVIYKYNASPNNPAVQSLIGVVLTTPDQYSGDLVPVQVAVGGQVESRITIPAETTPLFATFGGNGSELIASSTPSRIRIVWTEGGVGSFKKALLDIDFGLPLLAQSFATFDTAMQTPNIDGITPSGASGLSYATNLSNTSCQLERMGLAVDIGERTQGTYDEECSTTGCAESVSFEYNGANALAVDKGLRVYLADECRGEMQEHTDIATGETRQGGDAKFVGGGLLIPFPDPLEEVTGISTSGLSVRLRDGNLGACSVHYDGTKRTSCGGLIIAPDDLCDAESYQGLDVMKATECNFGTMMPGKALEIDESITTDPTTGQPVTTRNLGVVNVKVCGQSGLIINADNEIEYTGGGGGGSSITPCQCSGQWLNNGIFGVKVAAGIGQLYGDGSNVNALTYVNGCYVDESGDIIGYCSGVLAVLLDDACGLTLCGCNNSIQVKVCTACGIDFNSSGELVVTASGGDGLQNLATGTNSLAVYSVATTSADSVTIGCNANGSGTYAVAVGRNAKGSSTAASALGYNSNATGIRSTAFGYWSQATALDSTAIGNNSKANGGNSIAIGNNAWGRANSTTAIGLRACTNDAGTTVFSAWDDNATMKSQLKIIGKCSTIANNCTNGLSGLIYEEYNSSGTITTTQAKSFADLFDSSTACQCSGLWVTDGEFGVKVMYPELYCSNQLFCFTNALRYCNGSPITESGTQPVVDTMTMAVLVDSRYGIEVCGNSNAIQIKISEDPNNILKIGTDGGLYVCGTPY